MRRWVAPLLFALAFFVPPVFSQDNDTCLSCHGQAVEGIPFVDMEGFSKSIHAKNLCISCHQDAQEIPHPEKLAPVSCRNCHRIESQIYLQSDHGRAISKGKTEAATCTSCHGKTHTLLPSRNPASPVHRKNIPETCASCHADPKKMEGARLSEKEPFDTYLHSVHGEAIREGKINSAVCSDCHGTHDLHAGSNPLSKIYRTNIPSTCGRCHENVRQVYDQSVHGRAIKAGIKESPVCTDCHGEHIIRSIRDPGSAVHAGAITKTCSTCHESERIVAKFGMPADRLRTYQDSYHGLASRLGDLRAANCASCHGWHDILPSYDTRSSVSPKNLPMTCGKCHVGAQSKLIQGKIHGGTEAREQFWIEFFKIFYLILIPLVLGFMLVHNFSDYIRKTILGGRHAISTAEESVLRLNRQERYQHGFLLVTFLVLAYSGFALKFPEAWWAAPFKLGGEPMRKGIHRWTALVFSLTAVWHLLYMLVSRRGRFILFQRLWPTWSDLLNPFRLMAYNFGFRKSRPTLSYPSYIERVEYWALIWGSVVMIVTGSLLVFNDFTLKHFPLWISNLATMIHYYEAVLAFLSILIWHFYWVIFDPDVYPMNLSWLTGYLRRKFKKK